MMVLGMDEGVAVGTVYSDGVGFADYGREWMKKKL
jgi:hypothetical protein